MTLAIFLTNVHGNTIIKIGGKAYEKNELLSRGSLNEMLWSKIDKINQISKFEYEINIVEWRGNPSLKKETNVWEI